MKLFYNRQELSPSSEEQPPIFVSLLVGVTLAAWAMAHPGAVEAGSIFVPGADIVRVNFASELGIARGDVPGIHPGTVVSGSFVYDASEPAVNGYPVVDFLFTAADITFGFDDVLEAAVFEYQGTHGFEVRAQLQGRPELHDWSAGVEFEIFQEFGESNLFLVGVESDARAQGHVSLEFENAIPEPPTFVLGILSAALLLIRDLTMRSLDRSDLLFLRQCDSGRSNPQVISI
jgi:hypothetical protein